LDQTNDIPVLGTRSFYGGTDRAAEYAKRYQLCLIEPPLDLITRVPADMLCRAVRFGKLREMRGIAGPVFVKPADPIDKCFDAGVYSSVSAVEGRRPIAVDTAVLVSESVEWTSEFRCFIANGKVEAWSPYLSFGRPSWKPRCAGALPINLRAFCDRLITRMGSLLPPAFVVDVGVLEDGRWAVVEFNPAWCSGILGAEPERVFSVILRAARSSESAPADDLRWVRLGRERAS